MAEDTTPSCFKPQARNNAWMLSLTIAVGLSLFSFRFLFLRKSNVVIASQHFNTLGPEAFAFQSQGFNKPAKSRRALGSAQCQSWGHAGVPSSFTNRAAIIQATERAAETVIISSRFPIVASVHHSFRWTREKLGSRKKVSRAKKSPAICGATFLLAFHF